MTMTAATFVFQQMDAAAGPTSRVGQVALFDYARRRGLTDEFVRIYLAKRADWLAWQFRTQRHWQSKTRRPSKARHHDSISIRERYVRCSA